MKCSFIHFHEERLCCIEIQRVKMLRQYWWIHKDYTFLLYVLADNDKWCISSLLIWKHDTIVVKVIFTLGKCTRTKYVMWYFNEYHTEDIFYYNCRIGENKTPFNYTKHKGRMYKRKFWFIMSLVFIYEQWL